MKPWLAAGIVSVAVAVSAARGEQSFSKSIAPDDFTAAELNKLSPEALARLDALVQSYKSGAVAKARAEAAAEPKPSSPGFFAKAKVVLTPGTAVEYSDIDSRLTRDFTGWNGHTVFALENGQHWKVANGDSYYTPPIPKPRVKITPATMGGYWMNIEGVRTRVRVLPL